MEEDLQYQHLRERFPGKLLVQVIVNGMRVRIKLDEERIAELIKGTEPSAIPGLLRHLGNVASLSFTPYQNRESYAKCFSRCTPSEKRSKHKFACL